MSINPLHYDVWSDGSFRENDSGWFGGGGWIIIHDENRTEDSQTYANIPKDARKNGSDIAELLAVTSALANIPSGASLRLRLDAQNVIDSLKSGKLKTTIPYLQDAFETALTAIQSMGKVEFVKVSDRNNDNIKRANVLARTAASPSKAGK